MVTHQLKDSEGTTHNAELYRSTHYFSRSHCPCALWPTWWTAGTLPQQMYLLQRNRDSLQRSEPSLLWATCPAAPCMFLKNFS